MKYHALIVAAGTGSRMLTDIPKQFLELNGKPILMHTIGAFYHSDLHPLITVVLNETVIDFWETLCNRYNFTLAHRVICGGDNRFNSVKNGISSILSTDDGCVIAIHDAVRPLVSNHIITKSFQQAESEGSAVTMIRSRDSVRRISSDLNEALNRNEIYLVQTPQTFTSAVLKTAYEQSFNESFTDDASVVEKAGYPIRLLEGANQNIKITFPEDLLIAEAFLQKNK